jgi:hypothetical protein
MNMTSSTSNHGLENNFQQLQCGNFVPSTLQREMFHACRDTNESTHLRVTANPECATQEDNGFILLLD